MSLILNLENFVAAGNDAQILSSATFSQQRGERICIYGPSSSGKSILHKFIKGRRFDGINYQFDNFYLSPEVSVGYYDYNTPFTKPIKDISTDKSLLLVDEPEKGFSVEDFKEILSGCDVDQSLLFVTHNLDFVEQFTDKVLVLHYGAFKGIYDTKDFFNNDDPYIRYISSMGC